jgi:uroporphyrinogen decarboxylase
MTQLKNDNFLKALHREPTPYTPVWMMRQAGRYLPEYRATRQKAGDFLSLCKNPNLATEVTLQPLDRYPLLDASILFSDILTVPDAMGLGLYFAAGEGPKFERPLRIEADIQKLKIPDIDKDLKYVIDAVSQIKKALQGRVPLIGFSGSPWTLATYMVEGQGGTDFLTIKKMAYSRPDLLHHILKTTTEAVTQYLHAQIEAGVDTIMIFDSWGGTLSHQGYLEFSWP